MGYPVDRRMAMGAGRGFLVPELDIVVNMGRVGGYLQTAGALLA